MKVCLVNEGVSSYKTTFMLLENAPSKKKKWVFLHAPPTNGFLHLIIFQKYYFTPFKNDFQIIFSGIFPEHPFQNKFYEF